MAGYNVWNTNMQPHQAEGQLPRSILIVDDCVYREIAHNPDSVELLEDREAMVVPYTGVAESNELQVAAIRQLLLGAGQLVTGALLIKNPFEDDLYEFADNALETFASAKYHHLANVAKLLGAKEVKFLEAKVERDHARVGAALKAKVLGIGGEADASKEITKKLAERLEGRMTFDGADAAPADAAEYLRRRYLANDHQLRALVEMRTGANPMRHYKVTFSATRESDVNFKSALKMMNKIPTKAFDVGSSFAKTAESFRNIEINTEITF